MMAWRGCAVVLLCAACGCGWACTPSSLRSHPVDGGAGSENGAVYVLRSGGDVLVDLYNERDTARGAIVLQMDAKSAAGLVSGNGRRPDFVVLARCGFRQAADRALLGSLLPPGVLVLPGEDVGVRELAGGLGRVVLGGCGDNGVRALLVEWRLGPSLFVTVSGGDFVAVSGMMREASPARSVVHVHLGSLTSAGASAIARRKPLAGIVVGQSETRVAPLVPPVLVRPAPLELRVRAGMRPPSLEQLLADTDCALCFRSESVQAIIGDGMIWFSPLVLKRNGWRFSVRQNSEGASDPPGLPGP